MEDTKEQDKKVIIASDIGGTNSRFRVIRRSKTDPEFRELITEEKFPNKDYDSFEDVISALVEKLTVTPSIFVLAIAGARVGRTVEITNISRWPIIDADALKEKFGLDKFYLLNDFEASGYGAVGMDTSDETKCLTVHPGKPREHHNKLIIGPGTGLGCAIIPYNKTEGNYNVCPGEGGHTEYTVTNELELRLRNFCFEWFKKNTGEELTRLSTERVTAGPALPLLYEFFQQEKPDLEVTITPEEDGHVSPENVIKAALEEKDPLALATVNQFVKNLAVIVGDMAITTLSYSGIYLCGGVAVALQKYLVNEESGFYKTIYNKGRMSDRLAEMPVHLVIAEVGLQGSEQYGYQAVAYDYEE
ncbi:unnamed protein product [Moneuplotes crassus]|uniref:Glucokinase n=1 Tax=Euplotes crassus TaxID=5936 RepID=A0AAD1UGJ1_EUPCR|nr:unnamed protein product [Moneuplotes crassus]